MKIEIEITAAELVALGLKYNRPVTLAQAEPALIKAKGNVESKLRDLKYLILSNALDYARMSKLNQGKLQ